MRKVTGNVGVQPVECVNPKKDKWCVRFNIQNNDDESTAEYDEEAFPHKPTAEDIEKTLFDNGMDVPGSELAKIGSMLGLENLEKNIDECRNARIAADQYLQLMEVVREQHLTATEIPDAVALRVPATFYSFAELCKRGKQVAKGVVLRHGGKTWRVVQPHVPMGIYPPSINTTSLYSKIEPGHAGTLDDPIPYEQGMAFEKGKYYSQYGVVYLCILTTQTGYPYDLKDLNTIVTPT